LVKDVRERAEYWTGITFCDPEVELITTLSMRRYRGTSGPRFGSRE
jgi:hypothetical protein